MCVFIIALTLHAAGLLYHGPQNYYGKGRTDQLVWVTLGQYLVEHGFPYDNETPEIRRHPWTLEAGAMREQRTIPTVANAELAVASLSDAKRAYGVQSAFFAALVPVCVFVVFRSFSVWRPLALAGSLWVAVLPSLTKIHLDGFLGQVSVVFVFPLLLSVSRYRLERHWPGLILIAGYLAYLFDAYPEFYPFAVLLVTLLFASPWPCQNWEWIRRLALVTAGACLLNAPFLRRGVALVLFHFQKAWDRASILEVLAPTSGTALGWAETLFRPLPLSPALAYRAVILSILGAGLVALSAFFSRSLRNRYSLAASVAVPMAYLCLLASGRTYPKYPFWKVSNSFAWLLAVLVLIGLYRLALLLLSAKTARLVSVGAVCSLAAVSSIGYVREMRVVFRNEDNLASVNTPALRAAYTYLDNHPRSTILIRDSNPVVVGWLSYHGRTSTVYVDRTLLAGQYWPAGDYPFYAAPSDVARTLIVDGEGLRPGSAWLASAHVDVRNSQGEDRNGPDVWYWMGDALDFVIWIPEGKSAEHWLLEFEAMPGPSNPVQSRRLALTMAGAEAVTVEIRGRETVSIPVKVTGGSNIVRMSALWPTEQTVRLPNDPRKLMVRISNAALHRAQ